MQRFIIIILFCCLLFKGLQAQEMAGLVHSNHAGTDVLFFNPAGMHHQKDWLSIHLVTADVFLSNDYMYLKKSDFKFFDLLTGNINIPSHKTGYSKGEVPFYIYDRKYNTRLDMNIKVQGPSAMFIKNQHAFGVFTGFRTYVNSRNITPELGRTIYYGFGYDPQQEQVYNLQNFHTSVLGFGEVGLSYAYQWNRLLFSNWNFGISVKKLFGLGGSYLQVEESNYNVLNDTTLDILSLDANLGFSFPMDYNSNDFPSGPWISGNGWGFDLGVEYQQLLDRQSKDRSRRACGQRHYDYKYRIGISIMDIGWISFKSNAQLHQYANTQYTWENIDTTQVESVNQIIQEISTRFYGDPNASLQNTRFKMWLPTSINISGDYNFENDIYLNASLVYNPPLNGSFMRKPDVLSITPRYEKRNVELSVPVSLYQWKYPRVGLAFRFYYLTVGSDYFTSLLGMHDFNGMDLYFSIKVNLNKGSCERRNKINPCGDALNKFPWSK